MNMSRKHRQDRHRACDPCRKRKIKCSRGNPCGRCVRLSLRCEYSPLKPMGRPRQQQRQRDMNTSLSIHQDLPTSSPTQAGVPGLNDFGTAASEQLADLVSSVSFPAQGLPDPQPTSYPPWFEAGILEDSHLRDPLASLQEDTASTNYFFDDVVRSPSQESATCSCMELVHQQLSAMEDVADKLHSVKALRQSTGVAEKVLRCNICFDINRKPSEVSGNAQLLGSLMLTIATCYGNIFHHQQQKATEATHDASPVQLFFGHDAKESSLIELSVPGLDYWRLLKSGFSTEFDRLSSVCESFAVRQHQIHGNGHQECREGFPCRKPNATGRAVHPMDACPKATGSRASFTCFRTAHLIRAEIDNVKRRLSLES